MTKPIIDEDDAFDERGILKDGRSIRVPMRMADAATVITDSARHRPGFASDGRSVADRQAVYDAYDAELAEAYKNPPTSEGERQVRDQQEGDACTLDGAPGHLRMANGRLVCMPDRQRPARQDRATDASDPATVMRRHQQKMAQLYDERDRELADSWRQS